MSDRSTPSDKAKPDDSQAKSASELLLSITQRHATNTEHKPETPHFLSGGIKLAAADSLIAPAKAEPKPAATAGSMAQAYGSALGSNLKHQAEGMTAMLNTTQTSDAAYQRALRANTTVQQDSALVSLFKSASNIVTNIDKVPEALKKQGSAYIKELSSGDGNRVAAALGNTTAVIGTAFVPLGTASKAGTLSRETSILARGASEIKTVGADLANYSALRGGAQAQEALAATRVPRVPSRSAMESAAAETATRDAQRAASHLDDVNGLARSDKATTAKSNPESVSKPATAAGPEVTAARAPAKEGLSGMLDNGTASLTDTGVAARVQPKSAGADAVGAPHRPLVETPAPAPAAARAEVPGHVSTPETAPRQMTEPAGRVEAPAKLPAETAPVAPRELPVEPPRVEAPRSLPAETAPVAPRELPVEPPRVEAPRSLPAETAPVAPRELPVEPPRAEAPRSLPTETAPLTPRELPIETSGSVPGARPLAEPVGTRFDASPGPKLKAESGVTAEVSPAQGVREVAPASGNAAAHLEAPVVRPGEAAVKSVDAPGQAVIDARPQVNARGTADGLVAAPETVVPKNLDYGALGQSSTVRATEGVKEIGTTIENWTAAKSIHPELRGPQASAVKTDLTAVENTVKNFAEGRNVETFVPDMRKHIQSLEQSGATTMARDLTTKVEQVERLTGAAKSAQAVESASVKTAERAKNLSTIVDDSMRAMPPAQREVAGVVNRRLEAITEASARDPRAVQSLVDDLAKPEYSKFFAQSPELSTAMAQLKRESNVLGTSLAKADSSAVTMERVASSARLTEEGANVSQRVGQISQDIQAGVRADVPRAAAPAVQKELSAISRDLEGIGKSGAESRVIDSVRQRVEAISDAGAPKLAQELKNEVAKLETLGLNAERTRLIEQTGIAMQRDGELLGTKASQLQRQLHAEGVSAPSVGSGMPVKSQISRHLDNIAEQSGLVTGATDKVAAAASMRNSLARIEELGGARVLSPAQAKNLDEISKLVGNIDRQAVEMRGLTSTQRSVTTAGETIPKLTDDISKAVKVVGKEDVLAPNLKRIEEAASDLRQASTVSERAQAATKIAQELDNPAMREVLDRTARGQFAQAGIAREVRALDDAVLMAQRERAAARLQSVADNTPGALRQAESDIAAAAKPVKAAPAEPPVAPAPAAPSRLTTLGDDYSRVVKEATTVDPALASRRIESSYKALENEATKQGLAPQQINQLKADHELVRQSISELDQANKILVSRKLSEVEDGFRALEGATSTAEQRGLIKQTSDNIQDLRYLEGLDRNGAATLEAAQTGLMRAKADIEVATYRSDLVKLAASGDKQAQSQLLVAGLVTDGRKVTSLVPESFAPFSGLQTIKMPWQNASPLKNLSATDDFFTNNRGLFLNPRTIAAAKTVGALYYGAREINALSANIDAVKAEQAQENSLREPVIFGENARTVMRNAAAAEVAGRAVLSARPDLSKAPVLTGNERTAHGVFENDPDKQRKLENFARYGTPFVPLKYAAPAAEQAVAPAPRAFSLPMRFNWSGDRANGGLDKPASSQFVIPSAMNYASPFALSNNNHGARRDTAYGVQGSIFGGQSSVSSAASAAKLGADLTAAASYQEGSSGHDVKDLDQVEDIESGVDLPGSAPTVLAHGSQSANLQDEDDDDDNDTAAPVSAQRVPTLPGSAPVVEDKPSEPAKKTMAGPPRKRTNVIS